MNVAGGKWGTIHNHARNVYVEFIIFLGETPLLFLLEGREMGQAPGSFFALQKR